MYCASFIVALFVLVSTTSESSAAANRKSSQPLYVTPFIERGDIEAGQRAARVNSINNDNIESYSGFITINKQFNSNMFFWFYPAEKAAKNAPFIVWLHGGPGASSVYGLFELGPYYLDKNTTLQKRQQYLSQNYNMLYIDNPVGTGFSFTEDNDGYSRNETDIGENLYQTIQQFFKLFPNYRQNNFYISGSSYAGKFVTSFAYTIDQKQKEGPRINLKGFIVGNGYFEPKPVIQRSEILYQNGIIDSVYKNVLEKQINDIIKLIEEKKFGEALDLNNQMREDLENVTGYTLLFDVNYHNDQYPFGNLITYLENHSIRNKIHVGNTSFKNCASVSSNLRYELMDSVKPWFEYLVNKYRIILYSGQLDLEVPYVATERFIESLDNWKAAEEYRNAERKRWVVDNDFAGFEKTAGLLSEFLVRTAGHNAHIDKFNNVLELFERLVTSVH